MAGVYRQPPFTRGRLPSFVPSVPPKITGTATTAQAAQSDAVSAKLIFSGTDATNQAQSSAASGKEVFTATAATAQSQTSAVVAKEIFSGSDATAQSTQSDALAGKLIFSGSAATAQAAQVSLGSESEIFVGSAATAQSSQSSTASGTAGSSTVGRLSRRRRIGGGAVPFPVGEPPQTIPPTIAGIGSTSQRRQVSRANAKLHLVGSVRQFHAPQEVKATGNMVDTEMETMLAILMEVA